MRLRTLSEAECYTRCYGGWEQTVRLVAVREAPPAALPRSSGSETLRRLFDERLEARKPTAAAT